MRFTSLLVILLVFLSAILLQWLFVKKEGFSDSVGLEMNEEDLSFSELIQSLGIFTKFSDSTSLDKKSSTKDINELIQTEVSKQFKDLNLGPEDLFDSTKEDTTIKDTKSSSSNCSKVKSDALEQGSWFRNAASEGCPYAIGQNSGGINMDDYIRKDNIPCWGCTLK